MCGFVCAPFLSRVCIFIFPCNTSNETKAKLRKHMLEKNLPAKLMGECLQLLQTDGTWKTLEEFTMYLGRTDDLLPTRSEPALR